MAIGRTILAVAGLKQTTSAFKRRLVEVSAALGLNADFLAAVMSRESRGTFSPSVRNPISGAVGLIQFTGPAAAEQNTTKDALAKMSAEEQLAGPVREYYRRRIRDHGRLVSVGDHYLAVFAPIGIGHAADFVLYSAAKDAERALEGKSAQYEPNKNLDKEEKGFITVMDAVRPVQEIVDRAGGKRLSVGGSNEGLFFFAGPGDEMLLVVFVAAVAAYHRRRKAA